MGLLSRLIPPRSQPTTASAGAVPPVAKTPVPKGSASTVDFAVEVGDDTLLVRVRRHPRARRLRLRYDAALGELRLVMPPRGRISDARRWVEQQTAWIERQRATRAAGAPVQDGTVLPWRGQSLTIAWSAAAPRTPHIDGQWLRLGGPQDAIGRRVQRWLADQARREFSDASHSMARSAGLTLVAVSVGDPRSRWGSCTSTGRIRYNWRLVMAPDHVRTAIVAHEVAHLAHLNHGPAFYALVEQLCGDAHDRSREWLKRHGADLHRWRFDAV